MLFIRLLLASFIFISANANATTDWKLRKDEAGIRIFTRNVEGSPFQEFKAVVTIKNTTITGVLDVIMDVKNYPVNFPNFMVSIFLYPAGINLLLLHLKVRAFS